MAWIPDQVRNDKNRRNMTRSNVFICYNNNDKEELDQLLAALTPMIGEEHLATWDDSQILYNEDWEDPLADHFDEAEMVVLLLGRELLQDDTDARELFLEYVREAKNDGVYVLPWQAHPHNENTVLPFVMNNPFDQASVSLDTPESQDIAADRLEAFTRLILGLKEAGKSFRQQDDSEASDPEALKQLADHLKAQGYPKEAEALYLLVLAARKDRLGPDHPDTATSIHDLAILFEEHGLFDKAAPLQENLLSIYQNVHGKNSAEAAQALNDLGGIYLGLERYRDAQKACEEALRIRENTLGRDHLDTAESLHNQGVIFETQDLIDRAISSYERALAIREAKLGEEHQDTMTTVHSLALLYEEEGMDDKADVMFQRMYEVFGDEEPE
ncbi:MAG: tetratricopeptide repeat protein [Rhodothermaceae bacterium]|nr:tetratricopeptide repeat protein [Rhodothermaceae bacterium]